jgi:hypothetical protein
MCTDRNGVLQICTLAHRKVAPKLHREPLGRVTVTAVDRPGLRHDDCRPEPQSRCCGPKWKNLSRLMAADGSQPG